MNEYKFYKIGYEKICVNPCNLWRTKDCEAINLPAGRQVCVNLCNLWLY